MRSYSSVPTVTPIHVPGAAGDSLPCRGTALPASGRAGGQRGWRGSSSFHLTSRPRAANEESGLWFLWQLVFPKIQNKGPEGPILLPASLLPGVPCWECKIRGEKCIKPMSRLGARGVLPLQAPPHSPICSQKAAHRRLCPPMQPSTGQSHGFSCSPTRARAKCKWHPLLAPRMVSPGPAGVSVNLYRKYKMTSGSQWQRGFHSSCEQGGALPSLKFPTNVIVKLNGEDRAGNWVTGLLEALPAPALSRCMDFRRANTNLSHSAAPELFAAPRAGMAALVMVLIHEGEAMGEAWEGTGVLDKGGKRKGDA